MFLDFAIMSVLLVVAHLLRSRVRVLQSFFVPSSMVAGVLGLLGGGQVLDILPFSESSPGIPSMAAYPFSLVVMLFGTLFLGVRLRKDSLRPLTGSAGNMLFYCLASEFGLFGFALLFGLVVLAPLFPHLPEAFALMMPAGFTGGHGTATVIAGSLEQSGWSEARDIGFTFATVGLLVGVFGGMLLVNIATRRGWTRLVRSAEALPQSIRSGFLPPEERSSMGEETVSPPALDPLA